MVINDLSRIILKLHCTKLLTIILNMEETCMKILLKFIVDHVSRYFSLALGTPIEKT